MRIRHKTPAFAFGRGGYEGILKADIEVKAVSYTHLDVYKRQVSSRVLELYRRRLPDVFWCLVFRRIIRSYIEWSRGASVSYTHLTGSE